MSRYLTPILFFAATGYLFWYNGSHADSQMVLPFIDSIVPSTVGDPQAMGRASGFGALGLSVFTLCFAIFGHLRSIGRKQDAQQDD